jgi:adenylate cyclase
MQVARVRGLSRFVGRDAEMTDLERAAGDARQGRGQIVAVVGEPGVGKSRLFHEFIHSHHTLGWRVIESGSVSYGKATPYLPLRDLLRAYFRIETTDDVRAIGAKVTGNVLTLDEALKETIPPVLWLLDAMPEDGPFLALEPAERRRRTLAAVKALLLRESRVQPLVIVFEDLHWIDSETQAFLDSLVDSVPGAPILLAVNYRPEYQHGWGSKTCYRQLRIDALAPASAGALLEALVGDDPSVSPLKPVLIERSEGNPLFLEESVRAVVETGALAGHPGLYRLVKPLEAVTIPATVQSILAARIDRLAPEDKRLLQAAAVVGKDVPFALLQAIAELDEPALHQALGRLQAAEFVYEVRLFPELEYTFKHALTHEVAYGSLVAERKGALHATLVDAIERLHPGRLDEHLEQLAHHALRGQLRGQAVAYLQRAGDRAVARSAHREAATFFEQALPLLRELPDTPETAARTADVHLAFGTVLIGLRGPGSREVEASHLRARELAERLGDPERLYRALWGLWFFHFGSGRYVEARTLGLELLATAERGHDTGKLLEAHHALWPTLDAMGDSLAAQPHLAQGLALYDPAVHASQAFLYGGHDAGACCRYHLARTDWVLGYPDRAAERLRDALALAERLAHPLTLVLAFGFSAFVLYERGEWQAAEAHARRMEAVVRERSLPAWLGNALAIRVCAGLRRGVDGSLAELLDALRAAPTAAAFRSLIDRVVIADTACAIGDPERALAALDDIADAQRNTLLAPELRRIRGDVFLHQGRPAEAERCFREAIAIARRRSERSLELRATTRLARLLAVGGRRDEARGELSAIYAWFTEGFGTLDLREARALLDELGGSGS